MTSKPRIVVSRRLPPRVEEHLAKSFDVLLNPEDNILSTDELLARARDHGAEGLFIALNDPMSAETIARLPDGVRVINTYSVGYNHIDVGAAKARGIIVTYAPDATTDATADLALLLMLAACRRSTMYEAQLRAGQWAGWTAWKDLGTDPGGKVLGIVGMGRIGRGVARRARGFGMTIHYHQRRRLEAGLEQGAVFHDSVEGLFRASSIISLHAPSTPETHRMINRQSLSWLRPGAILVNTARGDLVDDDALIEALASGHLAGAGLDVFAGEPKFDRRYLDLPNATLLPHIGTSTSETRDRMGADSIANLEAVFAGREPPFRIC
jgi:Lactate dehydrogenase and related dehydrogenases